MMKRLGFVILVVLMVMVVSTSALADTWIVTTENPRDSLRIRLSSDHSVILGKLPHHQVFESTYTDRDWVHLDFNGQDAIVFKKLCTPYSNFVAPVNPASPGSSTSTCDAGGVTKRVNTGGARLNVRATCSLDGEIIGRLKDGTTVTVVSEKGDWSKIVFGNGYGYVYTQYLRSSGSASSDSTIRTVNTGDSKLNVRSLPSMEGCIIDRIRSGSQVRVIKTDGKWSYVTYSGGSGWVYSQYLKK